MGIWVTTYCQAYPVFSLEENDKEFKKEGKKIIGDPYLWNRRNSNLFTSVGEGSFLKES